MPSPTPSKANLDELAEAYYDAVGDAAYGRIPQPTGELRPAAPRLSTMPPTSAIYGTNIYLKREDLNHTGAHKINNALGLALLAKRMGKRRVIAETGAGHAVCGHGYGSRASGPRTAQYSWVSPTSSASIPERREK